MKIKPFQLPNMLSNNNALLNGVSCAGVIVNPGRTIQFSNSRSAISFAYKKNQLPGETVDKFIPEAFHQIQKQRNKKHIKSSEISYMDIRPEAAAIIMAGVKFPAELSLSLIQAESGILFRPYEPILLFRPGINN
jgi:sensor histidine kinase regulating citrate/malate metabolism